MPLDTYLTREMLTRLSSLSLKINKHRAISGVGDAKSLHSGEGIEFFEHKNYSSGMNIKHIDWRLFARTERLYLKVFEKEANINSVIFLDTSASSFGMKNKDKYIFSAKCAMSLLYLYTNASVRTTLRLFNKEEVDSVTGINFNMLSASSDILDKTKVEGQSKIEWLVDNAKRLIKPHSDIYIISDFFLEDSEKLTTLAKTLKVMKCKLTLLQVLSAEEREFPFKGQQIFVDSESGKEIRISSAIVRNEYLKALKEHSRFLRSVSSEADGSYFMLQTENDVLSQIMRAV